MLVIRATARELALDHDACIRILDEAGFLASNGCAMVRFCDVPEGLSADETKSYLRENGDQLCYPPRNELANSGSST